MLLLRAAELGGGAGLTFLRRRGLYFGHLRYLAALDRVVEVPLVLVDHALHRSALIFPLIAPRITFNTGSGNSVSKAP